MELSIDFIKINNRQRSCVSQEKMRVHMATVAAPGGLSGHAWSPIRFGNRVCTPLPSSAEDNNDCKGVNGSKKCKECKHLLFKESLPPCAEEGKMRKTW